MKKSNYKTLIAVLIILAAAVVTTCIVVTVVPAKRSSKAQKYDLECITEPRKNPLQECKDE